MVYNSKIPGTKYSLALTKKYNEWFLQLLIDNSVEDEYPVTDMSIGGIKSLTNKILDPISFLVNPLVAKRVIDDLISKTKHILVDFGGQPQREDGSTKTHVSTSTAQITSRLDEEMIKDISDGMNMLFQTTQEITEKLSQLEVRLSHLEKITNNLALITDNLLEK